MKIFSKFLISFLLLCFTVTAFGSTRELEVHLNPSYPSINFCIIPQTIFTTEEQKIYCNKLYQTLQESLSLGDIFIPISKKIPTFLKDPLNPETIAFCKKEKVDIIILFKIAYPEITISVHSVHFNSTYSIPSFAISNKINKDLEYIYQAANLIHKKTTGISGIAGTKILFSCSQTATSLTNNFEESAICIVDLNNKKPQTIINDHKVSLCPKFIPSISHPKYYLFVSYSTGIPKIFLHNLKTNTSQKLISLKGNQLMPTMSYQKDKIAFISDVRGNPDLYIQNFSFEKGSISNPIQLLSSDFGAQGNPCFSPDGNKIAFVSNKEGLPKIYIISLFPSLTIPSLLSKKHRDSNCPSWSPDGKKIVFCSLTNGIRQLWLIDLFSLEETQLTFCPHHKEDPSWAPNNTHIVFSMKKQDTSDLYVLSLITKKVKKLTEGPGEKKFPSWEMHMPQKMWRTL